VVAVHARRWMPTSGIEWKKGVVVTVHHGVQRKEEINVLLGSGRAVSAKLAGRDPSTAISAPSWAGPICTRNGRVPKGISTIFTIAFATCDTSASGAAVNSNPFMISFARLALGPDSYSFNRARCLNLPPVIKNRVSR
jgi:hypothetical protein